jgi:hypothetical protein
VNLFVCKAVKSASSLRAVVTFTSLFTILVEKWFASQAEKSRERQAKDSGGNRKGRDIGYALAANSCEGANDVESCTITAFDVITAFAVPYPGHILAE